MQVNNTRLLIASLLAAAGNMMAARNNATRQLLEPSLNSQRGARKSRNKFTHYPQGMRECQRRRKQMAAIARKRGYEELKEMPF